MDFTQCADQLCSDIRQNGYVFYNQRRYRQAKLLYKPIKLFNKCQNMRKIKNINEFTTFSFGHTSLSNFQKM